MAWFRHINSSVSLKLILTMTLSNRFLWFRATYHLWTFGGRWEEWLLLPSYCCVSYLEEPATMSRSMVTVHPWCHHSHHNIMGVLMSRGHKHYWQCCPHITTCWGGSGSHGATDTCRVTISNSTHSRVITQHTDSFEIFHHFFLWILFLTYHFWQAFISI